MKTTKCWNRVALVVMVIAFQAGCSHLAPPSDRSPYSEEIDPARERIRPEGREDE